MVNRCQGSVLKSGGYWKGPCGRPAGHFGSCRSKATAADRAGKKGDPFTFRIAHLSRFTSEYKIAVKDERINYQYPVWRGDGINLNMARWGAALVVVFATLAELSNRKEEV